MLKKYVDVMIKLGKSVEFEDFLHAYLGSADLNVVLADLAHGIYINSIVLHEQALEIEKLKENIMDKKMHQVSKRMETAEREIKKGKTKQAVKTLDKAEKKNEKLVKIDRTVRDPVMKKVKKLAKPKVKSALKKAGIKFPKALGKVK